MRSNRCLSPRPRHDGERGAAVDLIVANFLRAGPIFGLIVSQGSRSSLIEIDENLARVELSVIDQGEQHEEHQQVAEIGVPYAALRASAQVRNLNALRFPSSQSFESVETLVESRLHPRLLHLRWPRSGCRMPLLSPHPTFES